MGEYVQEGNGAFIAAISGRAPDIHPTAFIPPTAVVLQPVAPAARSSVSHWSLALPRLHRSTGDLPPGAEPHP